MKSFVQFINEGGNALANVSPIAQTDVKPTMDKVYRDLLPLLGLKKSDTRLLGSTGKKFADGNSGDIDLAVDVAVLMDYFKTDSPKILMSKMKSAARKISPEVKILSGIGIVTCAFPLYSKDGRKTDDLVQLDLMLTEDLNFSQWMYFSPAAWESDKKGLYRNSALSAIAHHAGRSGDETEWSRKLLNFSTGLHDVSFSKKGKNGNILKHGREMSRKFISKDPQGIIDVLLGPSFKAEDIRTWEDIYAAMESNNFLWKKDKKTIYKRIAADVARKGYPVPPEVLF